jgi:hypothetical protein
LSVHSQPIPEAVSTYGTAPNPRDLAKADGYEWDSLTGVQKQSYREASSGIARDLSVQHERPIPDKVTVDEFTAAVAPLFDLLNVTTTEVYDISMSGSTIRLMVVCPEATIPSTTRYGESGELAAHIVVQIGD